jgi:hypothetical protein
MTASSRPGAAADDSLLLSRWTPGNVLAMIFAAPPQGNRFPLLPVFPLEPLELELDPPLPLEPCDELPLELEPEDPDDEPPEPDDDAELPLPEPVSSTLTVVEREM